MLFKKLFPTGYEVPLPEGAGADLVKAVLQLEVMGQVDITESNTHVVDHLDVHFLDVIGVPWYDIGRAAAFRVSLQEAVNEIYFMLLTLRKKEVPTYLTKLQRRDVLQSYVRKYYSDPDHYADMLVRTLRCIGTAGCPDTFIHWEWVNQIYPSASSVVFDPALHTNDRSFSSQVNTVLRQPSKAAAFLRQQLIRIIPEIVDSA